MWITITALGRIYLGANILLIEDQCIILTKAASSNSKKSVDSNTSTFEKQPEIDNRSFCRLGSGKRF